MVPSASRRPLTLLGGGTIRGAPPGSHRFDPAHSLLPWFVLSAVIHVGLIAFALMRPDTPVPQRRAPDWFVAMTLPPESETLVELPPPPPELDAPEPGSEPSPDQAPAAPPSIAEPPGLIGPIVPDGAVTPGAVAPMPGPPPLPGMGRRYSAAERLRPEHRDPRLWRPLPEEIIALSPEQIAQLELNLTIAAVTDSMNVLAEAGRRATDWTYTDSQGRRWGISPGPMGAQLNLGDLVIPIPFGFAVPRTAEAARRAWMDADIAGQADRAVARASLKDRASEIRRRRDAERARARGDSVSAK